MRIGRFRMNGYGRRSYLSMTYKQRRQFRKLFRKNGLRGGVRRYFRY